VVVAAKLMEEAVDDFCTETTRQKPWLGGATRRFGTLPRTDAALERPAPLNIVKEHADATKITRTGRSLSVR